MVHAFKVAALATLAPTVAAWGALGHMTVALVAQNYVSSSTASWAQGILSDTSSTYLANVATWADSYRYTTAGKWSAPLHFIDAQDNPPSSCGVNYNRDCGSTGCVVSAIKNYTTRLRGSSYTAANKLEAMKFIVHFLGDIHQPLHDENLEVGGNDVSVTFAGTSTNLHAIWDTNMPEKLRGGYQMSDAQSWASDISTEINSGSYNSKKSGWLTGMTLSDYTASAMVWATDANAYVCTQVMPNGYQTLETGDLSGAYYNSNTGTIDLQIAKAGYRLAAWLNLIHDGSTDLSKRDMLTGEDDHVEPGPLYNRFLADPNSLARQARRAYEAVHGPGCSH